MTRTASAPDSVLRGEAGMVRQWAGVLGPAVIWAARFGVSYTIVPFVCTTDSVLLLHVITAVAVAAAAALGWSSWLQFRSTRAADVRAHRNETVGRYRFMGLLGTFSSALFVAVMVAEGLASFFVDPCHVSGPLLP